MTDRDLLKDIHEDFQSAYDDIQDIHEEGAIDMRFVEGDSWDPAERKAREERQRPCLVADEIGQFHNSVINSVRGNPRGVKFEPGDGSDPKQAQWHADKMREIEYRSGAGIIYSGAFQDAAHRGYGWVRWTMKYAGDRSTDKELWIEPVMNPDSVYPDPAAVWPDGRDLRFLFTIEERRKRDFQREFPDAKVKDFDAKSYKSKAKLWNKGNDLLQLGEYWYYESTTETLLMLNTSQGVIGKYESELTPKDLRFWRAQQHGILDEREVPVQAVKRCLTNGIEILEKTDWPGKYIPFASCLGMVLYVQEGGQTKRKLLSLTRKMRNPQQALNYVFTSKIEAISAVPRANYIGYKGQFKGHESDWADANVDPTPYLEFNGATEEMNDFKNPLPPPIRNAWDPPLQNLEITQESARRSIQAAGGANFLPSQAQRHNEKSGVALQEIKSAYIEGTFHLVDHYDQMIERMGVMGADLFAKVYDAEGRRVQARDDMGASYMTTVNKKGDPQSIMVGGEHAVTVTTGPAQDSRSDAVDQLMTALAGDPRTFPLVAGLLVKLKNIGDPIADKVAARLEMLVPPEIQQAEAAKAKQGGAQSDPAALEAENAQMKQQLAQAGQIIQQAQMAIQTDQAKQQAMLQKAQADAKTKILIAQLDAQTRLQIAQGNAMVAFETAKLEAAASGREMDAAAVEAAKKRLFDGLQAAADRLHDFQIAEIEHEHELERARVAHDQALEQGTAAAEAQIKVGDAATEGQVKVNALKPQPAPKAKA